MKKTWQHPELGTFEYDKLSGQWVGSCELPAFKVFAWEARSKPSGKYELVFDSPEGHEPSTGAAAIASLVVANHNHLASLVTPTLWEDFNGRGGASGMWWHGDMDQVAESFDYDDRPCPKEPADLVPVMCFDAITIHEQVGKYDKPVAELRFSAGFEDEHGVGLLTDGNKILGTGYAGDAVPFGTVFD